MYRPRNKAERAFFDHMVRSGWEVTKRGWPDYCCYKDGKVICVEVKARNKNKLVGEQARCMATLIKHGIPCYRWSFEDGKLHPLSTPRAPLQADTSNNKQSV